MFKKRALIAFASALGVLQVPAAGRRKDLVRSDLGWASPEPI